MKICLFGGSFDPIHTGHLIIAQSALEAFELDRVVFIPAYKAPHKPGHHPANAEQREQMVKLATGANPSFGVCHFEIEKKGVSYTHQTVRHFQEEFKGAELFFLLGLDLLGGLHTWKEFGFLCENVEFIVGRRKGYDTDDIASLCTALEPKVAERIARNVFDIPGIEISSTAVKDRIAGGASIKYIVPEKVEEYIYDNGLYTKQRI